MAKPINVEAKVVAEVEDAKQNIKEVGDEVDALKRKAQGAAKASSKDFGNFANLFSGLLPRNIQMMIRKFQSTQRAVGRLGRSLKFLKGAFAGLGIGLLILALEALIDNWEKISNLLADVNQEQEEYNKRVEAAARAVRDLKVQNLAYIRIAQENVFTLEEQNNAVANLSRSITELKGINRDTAEGQALFNEAIKRHMEIVREQSLQQDLINKLKEIDNVNSDEAIRLRGELFRSQVRLNRLDLERTAELERQAQASREATEAERERQRQQQLAIKNAEYREGVMQTLERDELLRSKDARDRARLELLYDWQDAQAKLENAKAEHEEIEALAVHYDNRLKDLERGFAEEDAEIRKQGMALFRIEGENQFSERYQKLGEEYFLYREQYADHQDLLLSLDKWYISEKQKIDDDASAYELRKRLETIDAETSLRNAKLRAAEDIATQLTRLSEEGTNAQKAFAITQVLLSQAQAVSSAIATAVKVAANAGPAAPVVTPLLIAQMVGIVLGSFAQVKGILDQAGAGGGSVGRGGGGGGGRGGMTGALVPQGVGDRQLSLPQSNQAFIVQSELQGQMQSQGALEKRLHLQ